MKFPLGRASLFLLLLTPAFGADSLKYTISGDGGEKADLETLSPSTGIPSPNDMSFSLDGGKSAIEGEVVPLSVTEAALKSDKAVLQPVVLPLIPESPFLGQPVPPEGDISLSLAHELGQGAKKIQFTSWEFLVVDENDKQIIKRTGEGTPPGYFEWDGRVNDELIMKPDESYFSFIILKSSDNHVVRLPGEAERYLAFSKREGNDEVIVFGERVYERDKANFSMESKIYLMDLNRRLSQLPTKKDAWLIRLYNPATKPDENPRLQEQRKALWKVTVEKILNRVVPDDNIKMIPTSDAKGHVEVVLKDYKEPSRPNMRGMTLDPRPQLEDMKTWIQWKETKEGVIIEMRHDRLFRAGSAYFRDEALPLLAENLEKVRKLKMAVAPEGETAKEKKSRQEKETILLRSYMEKPRETKKGRVFEGDPKLAALRSKVLFTLFAETRFLP